jgi:hypothetical protein
VRKERVRVPEPERAKPAPRPPERRPAEPEQERSNGPTATVLDLQRSLGNAAVSSLIQRSPKTKAKQAKPKEKEKLPPWSRGQLLAVQKELRRLGLYRGALDKLFGPLTRLALVEAFGDESWRTLEPTKLLEGLKGAKPPPGGKKGEHRFRYGELFKDGVLDMTLGIGFDEGGAHLMKLSGISDGLVARGFEKDDARARAALEKQAGRKLGDKPFGTLFVRKKPLDYTPPAGPPRKVEIVIRLVVNEEGDKGSEAAGAFKEGMVESDIAYYTGHGRYGSGPDFDRNMAVKLIDEKGAEEPIQPTDYDELEAMLAKEGKPKGRTAWQQFLWRQKKGRIKVERSNAGNVLLNPKNLHKGEFGANFIYWALESEKTEAVTGKHGELAEGAAEHERDYRIVVFSGCRTTDYKQRLKETPGFDPRTRKVDVLGTSRSVFAHDAAGTLLVFLDSVLAQQSAEQTIKEMDAEQSEPKPAYEGLGIGDNPLVK